MFDETAKVRIYKPSGRFEKILLSKNKKMIILDQNKENSPSEEALAKTHLGSQVLGSQVFSEWSIPTSYTRRTVRDPETKKIGVYKPVVSFGQSMYLNQKCISTGSSFK